jgi:ATP-binding cassette subfamily F protein 3
MSLLVMEKAVLRIAGRPLLDGADLTLGAGQRVGLVGRNGVGKSTLLKVIAGELQLDGGALRLARNLRLGTVRQDAPDGQESPLEHVLAADTERAALLAEAETAAPERLADIHHRLDTIGADAAPARAATILAGLGFDVPAQARPLATFSGGWRMRVALAAVLFSTPDLLLLDEPTNHLDLEATLWLETWLLRFPGAALIVSHDRSLLDRTVMAIAHLDRGRDPRRLRGVHPHPHRTRGAPEGGGGAHRRPASAHAGLRRPLPLQGEQGAPGAVPPQGHRQAADDRDDDRRRADAP